MYKGEIKVQENELVSVLNTAQGLEIKGLSENSTPPPTLPTNISKPEQVFSNSTNNTSKRPPITQSQVTHKRQKLLQSNDLKGGNTQEPPPGPSGSHDPGHFETSVKQEITPVTIDLDDGDGEGVEQSAQQAGLAGFEGQELAFCDPSETSGYDDIGGYDEGEYFAGMEPQTNEVDRVSFSLFNKLFVLLLFVPFSCLIMLLPPPTVNRFQVHISSGQYSCHYCGKEQESNSALAKHLRVHTKEKPFQCRYCQKSFVQTSSRKLMKELCTL